MMGWIEEIVAQGVRRPPDNQRDTVLPKVLLEQFGGREPVEFLQHLRDAPGTWVCGEVVPDPQGPVRFHPCHQFIELQGEQATVGAEFDHVPLDLVGDPTHHLQPLHHGHGVPDRDQIFDLQRGQPLGIRLREAERRLARPGRDLGSPDAQPAQLDVRLGGAELEVDRERRVRAQGDVEPATGATSQPATRATSQPA